MQPSAGICCRAYHHIARQRACRRSSSLLFASKLLQDEVNGHPCRTCHRQCPFRHRIFYQIRARQIGGHGRRGMPRSHIRWPTVHSEGAATGGAHGRRWRMKPPRHFIDEHFAKKFFSSLNPGRMLDWSEFCRGRLIRPAAATGSRCAVAKRGSPFVYNWVEHPQCNRSR